MTTRRLLIAVVVMTLTTTLAVCRGGNHGGIKDGEKSTANAASDSTATTDNAAAITVAEESAQSKEKFAVSYMDGLWDTAIPAPVGPAVTAINEKFDIDFKPRFIYMQEYPDKLAVTMAGGDLPDMIGQEGPDANFVKWAKQGAFLPLNDIIKNYPTLSQIPQDIWDSVSVDGNVYAIPRWFPKKYGKRPVIRKDWLDNLGLKMPTNYEELKHALVAFTKQDPDKNGRNDTLGMGISSVGTGLLYGAAMSVGWDSGAWYYKNDKGQLIPGTITSRHKDEIQFLADLYKEGALSKDWAVAKQSDVRNDFFTGKYGMYFEQPYDFNQKRFTALRELQPTANLAIIPPFAQEDGLSGYVASGKGFYQMIMLNGNLKDQPEKADRILGMLDYMSTFVPWEQRNADHADFDWQNGGLGKGYEIKDGIPVDIPDAQDARPKSYLIGRYWAPNEEAVQPQNSFTDPLAKQFVQDAVETLKAVKFYKNPVDYITSAVADEKGSELDQAFTDHVTRMIVGNEKMDNWDTAVKEYLDNGGQEIIDDVNKIIREKNVTPGWE
ncbi:extracellular solute-binding protein [Paenibacillus lignilyticus]|uniref:Extracellular solute-binding protein n=1 Tax=Paenibacillus lignilyticus TaxID=1172615 RepID=A0ABS5CDR3_9BACL|nr:extracellular solute-binding protein [Paenibacillus lignilyticus]MBP3963975.1 extracellular solute-binding protein [Paenibacillus lignilyticus]